jgi:hypothetical protein
MTSIEYMVVLQDKAMKKNAYKVRKKKEREGVKESCPSSKERGKMCYPREKGQGYNVQKVVEQ